MLRTKQLIVVDIKYYSGFIPQRVYQMLQERSKNFALRYK